MEKKSWMLFSRTTTFILKQDSLPVLHARKKKITALLVQNLQVFAQDMAKKVCMMMNILMFFQSTSFSPKLPCLD